MKDIKVLIVEDERIIAEDIKRILLKYQYQVVAITSSGEEAIIAADKFKPDVVLMDIILQGEMSGIAASREINKNVKIPIIYITSYLDKHALSRIKNLESYAYLMKPFEDKELYATIELAVYKFRMESILWDYNHKIEKLHLIASKLAAVKTLHEVYQTVSNSVTEVLGFKNVVILENLKAEKYKVISSNFDAYQNGAELALPLDIQEKIEERDGVIYDYETNSEFSLPLNSVSSVMVMGLDRVGVVIVFSQEESHFGKYDFNMLGLLLKHATEDIKRIKLQEELKNRAVRDSMTDCYNRFFLFNALDLETKKAKRNKSSIAFLMIDVNGLKLVNDNLGHSFGDQLLVTVAQILKEASRETDVVVRYGGDEFLVMMPETMLEAEIVINRIRTRADDWNKKYKDLPFSVSFAIGCAYWKSDGDESVEDVLARADERMYENKKSFKMARINRESPAKEEN